MSDASDSPALHGYAAPGRGYDEAIEPSGAPRPVWRSVARAITALTPSELIARQRQADRLVEAEGASYLFHDDGDASRPWRLDPLPLVLDAGEWAAIEQGVAERMRVLNAMVADIYGERSLLRRGDVPPAAVFSSPGYVASARGGRPRDGRWISMYAVDLVRLADGAWCVLRDVTDAPAGIGYALVNRNVSGQLLPDVVRDVAPRPLTQFLTDVRSALDLVAPPDRASPRTVVLSPGLGGAGGTTSYFEHSYLAAHLGYHLAEPADLVVRQDRVWLRALSGLEPVDVLLRRLESEHVDPLESPDGGSGVPGLARIARTGGVGMANAVGAGVVASPGLLPSIERASRALGEELTLPFVAQDNVALASAPALVGGTISAATIELRVLAAIGKNGIAVMPGGFARVAPVAIVSPTNGLNRSERLVKDVWVVDERAERAAHVPTRPSRSMPQVDLRESLPTRSAEALYWAGRAAERAETMVRATATALSMVQADPALLTMLDGAWRRPVVTTLRAFSDRARPESLAPEDEFRTAVESVLAGQHGLPATLAALGRAASSSRQFVSAMTWRVLGELDEERSRLTAVASAFDPGVRRRLDTVLVSLSSLAGLFTDSMVRGPAWRFLELGRRVERGIDLLGLFETVIAPADPAARHSLFDYVLAASESLVAYRRRYRSDAVLDALVDLLVLDDANPRALAFQLDQLRTHVATLPSREGSRQLADAVEAAGRATLEVSWLAAGHDQRAPSGRREVIDRFVLAARGPLLDFADRLNPIYFNDPTLIRQTMGPH